MNSERLHDTMPVSPVDRTLVQEGLRIALDPFPGSWRLDLTLDLVPQFPDQFLAIAVRAVQCVNYLAHLPEVLARAPSRNAVRDPLAFRDVSTQRHLSIPLEPGTKSRVTTGTIEPILILGLSEELHVTATWSISVHRS